jgi:hypothetical protein
VKEAAGSELESCSMRKLDQPLLTLDLKEVSLRMQADSRRWKSKEMNFSPKASKKDQSHANTLFLLHETQFWSLPSDLVDKSVVLPQQVEEICYNRNRNLL